MPHAGPTKGGIGAFARGLEQDAATRILAAVVESSAHAILSKDLDGTICTWNRGAERLYGYSPDEAVGRSVQMLVPEDRAEEWSHIMGQLARGEPVEQLETERVRKDGRRIAVTLTLSPIRDSNDKLVCASEIGHDITDRKRAEQALRASQEDLAASLADMARLQAVSTRMVQSSDSTSLLLEIVDTAIALTTADKGNIQLLDRSSGMLTIVASRGFERPFLEFFKEVHKGQAACGIALQSGKRVVIDDVIASPVFAATPALDVLLSAGVRALQTTPLVSRSGQLVGMLSTHYRTSRGFADRDIHVLDLLTRQAADWVERTHAEQALRESEGRFRLTADAAPVLIWMSGTDNRCTWFNKPWLDFVGRPMEQELGNGWAENIHADDYEGRIKTYTTAFDARRPFSIEYRLKRHDGVYRWLLDNGVPVYGANAEFRGYIGSCIDITERRKAEESAAETIRHLNLAMSAGRMAAWTWDPHKDVVSTSANLRELCGVSSIDDREHGESLLHPDDRVRHSEIVDNAVKHGTAYQSVFRIIRPDNGQVVWLDLRAVPVTDCEGHVTTLSGVAIDITERKRGEHDLFTSEQRLRAILATAMDAIITMDIHGMIQSVNPAAERLFGYTAAEMIGHNVGLLMPSPYREEHDGYLRRYLQTGKKHIIGIGRELEARRQDGSVFPMHLVVSEIEDRKLFTGILRDMTEYKRLERDVLDVATLEQQRIGQELHDGVSQEFAGLTMITDALAQQLKDLPPQAELAEKVVAGLQRLQNQSRELARGLIPVDVDPEGLCIALENLADRTCEQSGVNCSFQLTGLPEIPDGITATHLLRIAQEAVLNACRHGRAKNIHIILNGQDKILSLTIHDDGIGLPEQPNHGKGLGIRIMRNRASVIGGTLTIALAEGGGTLVNCILVNGRRSP